jgi:hypothetical protein
VAPGVALTWRLFYISFTNGAIFTKLGIYFTLLEKNKKVMFLTPRVAPIGGAYFYISVINKVI